MLIVSVKVRVKVRIKATVVVRVKKIFFDIFSIP